MILNGYFSVEVDMNDMIRSVTQSLFIIVCGSVILALAALGGWLWFAIFERLIGG
jgi:hypothetical protein